ncbi:MAG: M48 family metallopeptidase [Bdellovibrionales bacterium]|nr:M48 family metallopeptidase [Bdellovibrionales bacterium]
MHQVAESQSSSISEKVKSSSQFNVDEVKIKSAPGEKVYFAIILACSVFIWIGLCMSIIGLIYAILIGFFILFSHLVFITYIRGSAVKLGPDQFPELYTRCVELSKRAGLNKTPDFYIMQAGGSLNAFATKFCRSKFVVLFSDLLEACEDSESARDMIIGHELGHIKAGHLRWFFLTAPGMFIPFLGSAYSRAREYTCDRYGAALCGNEAGAIQGLIVLAVGGKLSAKVNIANFVSQGHGLNNALMTLGKWLSSYPPLCDRISAVSSNAKTQRISYLRGSLGALALLCLIVVLPTGATLVGWNLLKDKVDNSELVNQEEFEFEEGVAEDLSKSDDYSEYSDEQVESF